MESDLCDVSCFNYWYFLHSLENVKNILNMKKIKILSKFITYLFLPPLDFDVLNVNVIEE